MDGRSSLDEPTGTRKYSMSAPSDADRAAKRERKTNDLVDRNLQRAMRTGTPQQRVAAGVAYQERSSRPGYRQGGGVQSAEGNRNRDGKTADNFTKEGLRLQGKENPADVVAGQADAANKPASPSMGDGSGRDAANARGSIVEGSTGGEWTNVGPSATDPATTPPVAQGGAVNGTSAGSDSERKLAAIKKNGAVAKFGEDLANFSKTPAKDRPEADRIFEYGKTLGISEDQINAQIAKFKPKSTIKNEGSSLVSNISEKYAGQGIQDGDKEVAESLLTMSPEARLNSNRDAASIKFGKDSLAKAELAESEANQSQYEIMALRGEDPPEDLAIKQPEKPTQKDDSGLFDDPNPDFGSMSTSDPRYKSEAIKQSSYSQAWWETPGSLIPSLKHDLNKDPKTQVRDLARSKMITKAISENVDISRITKQDDAFNRQYEEAKKNYEASKLIVNRQQESSQLVSSNDRPL